MSSDNNSQKWLEVQRRVFSLWRHDGDVHAASRLIEDFLRTNTSVDESAEATAVLGDLAAAQGDLPSARKRYLDVLSMCRSESLLQYSVEISLGDLAVQLGNEDEGQSWYRKALETCTTGNLGSCGAALRAFLHVQGERLLDAHDSSLLAKAVQQSWFALKLPDEPDLTDIPRATERITTFEKSAMSDGSAGQSG